MSESFPEHQNNPETNPNSIDFYDDIQDIVKVGHGDMTTFHRPDGKFLSKYELDMIRENQDLIRGHDSDTPVPSTPEPEPYSLVPSAPKQLKTTQFLIDKTKEQARIARAELEEEKRQQWFRLYKSQHEEAMRSKLADDPEKLARYDRIQKDKTDALTMLGVSLGQTVNAIRSAGVMEQDWMVYDIEPSSKSKDPTVRLVRPPKGYTESGRVSEFTLPFSLFEYWQSEEGAYKYLGGKYDDIHDIINVGKGKPPVLLRPDGTPLSEDELSMIQANQDLIREVQEYDEENARVLMFGGPRSVLSSLRAAVTERRERRTEVVREATRAVIEGDAPSPDLIPVTGREVRAAEKASRTKKKALRQSVKRRELEQTFGGKRGAKTPLRHRPANVDYLSPAGRLSDLGTPAQKDRLEDGIYTRSERRAEKKAARQHKRVSRRHARHVNKNYAQMDGYSVGLARSLKDQKRKLTDRVKRR